MSRSVSSRRLLLPDTADNARLNKLHAEMSRPSVDEHQKRLFFQAAKMGAHESLFWTLRLQNHNYDAKYQSIQLKIV